MNHLENLAQSYSQAPWRKQLQLIGLFSLFLVSVALVAGIYLSRKEHAKAAELLETASKANPTSADTMFWLGVAYRSAEQPPRAGRSTTSMSPCATTR